ncbi:MAG TPA: tyrosine-type recombinase/integrase [Ktedonobacteraceae bacterium]|nr:tyrosine-type recombinase/integrase [Ktedonobacteraceae bacterium]
MMSNLQEDQTFDQSTKTDYAVMPFPVVTVGSAQNAPYDDRLALVGQIADSYAQSDAFAEAQATWTDNTRRRYFNDLELFSAYLQDAQIERPAEALFNDAEAWRGMSFGLLKGFKTWLEQRGYATGTIKGCISTIHVFCRLAGPGPTGAGVLDEASMAAILTVRGTSGRKARNLDEDRKRRQIPTRKGYKKTEPTKLSTVQALTLKKITTHPERPRTREHDLLLTARDALLMGLLVEHALRCSEVALLTIDSIDLRRGTISIYRPKTDRTDTQKLHKHTRLAAEVYLSEVRRQQGPLFTGYDPEKPLSTRAINKRVAVLGGELGIGHLSPHDLRHHWAFDALLNHTPLNIVQVDGGWETEYMPLRYAHQAGATGGGATITEDDDDEA